MCQNTNNDYSLRTANTGIGALTDGNPLLSGAGAVTVFTAGENGSVIKSIIIKATQQSLQGMVRLFISDNKGGESTVTLYREVPIPIAPQAATTPVPAPQYTMYETVLEGDIKLGGGYLILASTQNTETFNVIVEGLDWTYPETLPDTCCNFMQEFANTGQGLVSTANTNLDGTGTIARIFTANAGTNGSLVKAITIKALQNTHEGVVRLFVSPAPGGGSPVWSLMQEVWIPQTTQSGFEPSYKQVIAANFNLQAGYLLGATTQVAEKFAITVEGEDWSYPIS